MTNHQQSFLASTPTDYTSKLAMGAVPSEPRLAEDIKVGPIFDQREARAVAEARMGTFPQLAWNGQWRTIEQNRMSVIGMRRQVLNVTITAHGTAYSYTQNHKLPSTMELVFYVHHGEELTKWKARELWTQLVQGNLDEYPASEVRHRIYKDGLYCGYFLSPDTWAKIYIHKTMDDRQQYMEWFPLRNAQCFNAKENGCYLYDLLEEIKRRADDLGHNGDIRIHYLCCRVVVD